LTLENDFEHFVWDEREIGQVALSLLTAQLLPFLGVWPARGRAYNVNLFPVIIYDK